MEELCITNNVFDLDFWSLQFCFPGRQTFGLCFVKKKIIYLRNLSFNRHFKRHFKHQYFLEKPFLKLKHSKRKAGLSSSILNGGIFFGNIILKLFCISIFSIVIILFVILRVTQAWRRYQPTMLMSISNCKTGVQFLWCIYGNSKQEHMGILSAD